MDCFASLAMTIDGGSSTRWPRQETKAMVSYATHIGDLALESGTVLRGVTIGYEAVGTLSPGRDNAILVLHGYTSGPDMILDAGTAAEGSWSALIGPGKPLDTERYFILCPNTLGSTYGSTGAASIDPATGTPYGSRFPDITMRDVVASQHRLLETLGISSLVAVLGPSFGGLQPLQWAVSYPHAMRGVVPLLASLGRPPANVEGVRAALARDPHWNGGDYYAHGNLAQTLTAIRIDTLKSYGIEAVLSRTIADPAQRAAIIEERARQWAQGFDANALLVLIKAIASHDVSAELHRISARVLYILSRTDKLFPPSLAPDAMARFQAAGVEAQYLELDSENGHAAASTDIGLWADTLRQFLAAL